MENLLEQIKGVVGVSGAMIYDRELDETRMLMPANFDEEIRDELGAKFLDLLGFVDDPAKFRIKLSRGWLIIRLAGRYAILIVAKGDLNISTLDLVLKSIQVALDNKTYTLPEKKEVVFTEDSSFTLVRAINLMVEHFSDTISRFQLAQMLRQSKSDLLEQYPDLKHFTVEHNASVILIKGSESRLDSYSIEAVAAWMNQFKEYAKMETVMVGFNLKDVTGEIRRDLDNLGFYRKFQQFAHS
ncbi:MAG TPA: hypothetical protein ENO22_07730 [candidate division Zixibacteria bacterium]|nr:hypothetical protein [candidate division Zixibacteria bacterium]HEQ99213.1 hypothetical protein [candidate division Zixibacteria bacterium]